MSKKTPEPVDRHIGLRVRARRLELHLSQTDLANGLKLTFQQVQKYEKGANRIGGSRMQQIADILKVPPAYFYEGQPGAKRGVVPAPSPMIEFMAHKNAADLARNFMKLNPQLQVMFCELVEGMADAVSDN